MHPKSIIHLYIVRFALAVVLLAALPLQARADGDPSVRQAKSDFDSRKTYLEGVGIGALFGAAVGAVTGGLHRDRNGHLTMDGAGAARGAAIGSAAGGTAGAAYANRKVQERREYQQKEGVLGAAIAQAESDKRAAAKFNRVLASRLSKLKRDDEQLEGTIDDSESVLKTLNSEISREQKILDDAQSNGATADERAHLRKDIASLKSERIELQGYIDKLAPNMGKRRS